MKNKICIQAIVIGKVQGVFFRHNTFKQAQQLNVNGLVRNLFNGNVEVIAAGNRNDINKLITWLQTGPPQAQVEKVEWQEIPYEEFIDFKVADDN